MNRLDHLHDLLACLRGEMPDGGDWASIICLANRSLCTPLMARRFQETGRFSMLPGDVRQFLAEIQTRNGERNRRLLVQLDEAAALLNGADVQPVLLKGTAWLANVAGQRRADRMITDLDLMVPSTRLHDVIGQLSGAGYRLGTPLAGPEVPVVMLRPDDVGTIDLHTEYGGKASVQFRHADLAEEGSTRRLTRGTVHLPSAVASVAILLLHDQLKGRDYLRGRIDLRHLLDMQMLAAEFGADDWQRLDELFAAGYARAAARTQLLTAHSLLKIDVPRGMMRDWRARLQYRRRVVQIYWPATALPLTMLSMLDPQYLAARRRWKRTDAACPNGGAWLPRRESVARLFSWKEVGKI